MDSIEHRANRWSGVDALAGPLLGLLALAVYAATMSRGAFPGESAALIAQRCGLFPAVAPSHSLWSGLAWVCDRLPGGAALKLNALSAVCGAICVGLLYGAVSRAVRAVIDVDVTDAALGRRAARLAGLAAALFLAFCAPFWIVSTRAHTASLDILLVLIAAWLFVRYASGGAWWMALALAFVCGAGVVEYAAFLALAPLAGIGTLFVAWRRGHLSVAVALALAGCGLAGLSLFGVAAAAFMHSPDFGLSDYSGWFHVVRKALLSQYLLLMHGLPREGWLIVLLTTTVPWLACLAIARRGLNDERDWGYYLLHVIVTLLSLAVLLNFKIAPWPMLGLGRLLPLPYVFAAGVFGYVVAYWCLFASARVQDIGTPAGRRLRAWLGPLVVAPGLAAPAVMAFVNARAADGRQGAFADRYAGAVLDCLGDRSWVVTDGMLDSHLAIAARDLKRPLRILSLPLGRHTIYLKSVASGFEDVRLQNLTRLGLVPAIQEWIRTDGGIGGKLAVLSSPELWTAAGHVPVPHGLVFLGARDGAAVAGSATLETHRRLWRGVLAEISASPAAPALEPLRARLLRHAGMVANNLGVMLEDQGLAGAAEAYAAARQLDSGNISALLNLASLAARGVAVEGADAIRAEVDALAKSAAARPQIWALARTFGYVRQPQAYADLGMTWALSGEPGLAAAGIRRAMDLLPEDRRGRLKQTLAALYFAQEDDAASRSVYQSLLEEKSQDGAALLGLARIAIRAGELAKAGEYLRRAEEAGMPRTASAMEWAALHAVAGDAPRARVVLEELVALDPQRLRAWATLVAVIASQGDAAGLERCIARLEQVEGTKDFELAVAHAHLAILQRDTEAAREHLERAHALRPRQASVMEMLLRLDLAQGRMRDVERHARALLAVDPDSAAANYAMAGLHMKEGNRLLAEDSYRRAIERSRDPGALNDMAWLLQTDGRYAEAEALAREAAAKSPAMAGAWDTLGVVLMKLGRIAEAEEAMRKALALSESHPAVQLHLAMLARAKGDTKGLRDLLETLAGRESSLSADEQRELRDLWQAVSP